MAAFGRAAGVKSILASARAALGVLARLTGFSGQVADVAQSVEIAAVWRTDIAVTGAWQTDMAIEGEFVVDYAIEGRAA